MEESAVLTEEQPYEIPENWIWVTLKDVCDINMGQSPKGEYTTDDSYHIPLIGGPADMGETYPNAKRYTTKPTKLCENGELIVSVRATLGKTNIADGQYCLGRGVAGIKSNIIEIKLLRYYFEIIKPHLYSVSTGTTFQQISKGDIENIAFPLSHINEQKRIVDKVERLLNKIEEAREMVVNIPESLKRLKLSVLHDACTGKLTADWRRENGIESEIKPNNIEGNLNIPTSWSIKKLKELSEKVSVGHVGITKEYYCDESIGVPFIRSQNVRPGKLDLKEVKYITKDFHKKLKKSQLQAGDLLVVRVGANRGDSCIVPDGFEQLNCANIVFARPKKGLSAYLDLYFQSNLCQNLLLGASTGSAQGVINTKSVAEITVPFPPEEEQSVIVERVKRIFKSIEKILKSHGKLVENIDNTHDSILSKAFRGELGTNDPSEESAIELLKEVLQEQVI